MTRIGVYCRRCFGFVRLGPDGGPCGGLEWIAECGWCEAKAAQARAAQAEVERLEALWAARECAAPDCDVVFEPARAGQLYCCDSHRKRTNRRAKAAREAAAR